jgi:SOS response regulatory protein OraA/RecX
MTENDEAYRLAVRWLSSRSLSGREIQERLRRRGIDCPPGLIERLEERGWLSEQAVAEAEVLRAERRHWGPARLRERLRQRGVAPAVLAEAVRDLGSKDLVASAWEQAEPLLRKGLTMDRVARHLERRGFSPTTIAHVIERLRSQGPVPSEPEPDR